MSVSRNLNGTSYTLPTSGESDWDSQLSTWFQGLSQLGAGILFFGNASVPNSGTNYLRPLFRDAAADTTEVKVAVPFSGVIRALYVQAGTGPTVSSHTFTVRKNGADTSMVATLAASGTQGSDTANSVTVTAGDTISIKTSGTPGVGASLVYASLRLSPA